MVAYPRGLTAAIPSMVRIATGLQTLLRVIQKREKALQLLDLAWNALNVPAAVPLRVFLVRSAVQQLFLNNNRFDKEAMRTCMSTTL